MIELQLFSYALFLILLGFAIKLSLKKPVYHQAGLSVDRQDHKINLSNKY